MGVFELGVAQAISETPLRRKGHVVIVIAAPRGKIVVVERKLGRGPGPGTGAETPGTRGATVVVAITARLTAGKV